MLRKYFLPVEVFSAVDIIISEETFINLLEMQGDDEIPNDIMDTGYEDDDLDGDDLMYLWN